MLFSLLLNPTTMRIQSFIIIISAFFTLNLSAQISMEEYKKKRKAELEQYKNRVKTEFEKYREKRNSEFARLISQRWKAIQDYKGLEPPVKPEPVKPIIKDRNEPKIPPVKIPIDKITKIPKPEKRVPLNIPGTIPYDECKNVFSSTFYGAQVTIYSDREDISIKLRSIDEQEIGKAWNELSDGRMEEVVNNFLIHREEMKLNDYTFAIMVGKLCYGYYSLSKKGEGGRNEAVLMHAYVLAQCGYDVKIARKNSDLFLLLAIKETVYKKNYLTIGNKKYYLIEEYGGKGSYYTFTHDFSPMSQSCSMQISERIQLDDSTKESKEKVFASKKYPDLAIKASVDINLMKLYNDYPMMDWQLYAKTPMSTSLENKLLPTLRQMTNGKSKEEATGIILNFVQTAFEYKTDEEQFGYERPLFVDELFYYDYSDCEDRAILFSYLVRKVLNLDVVLLYYPNHLATAVKLPSYNKGDYVSLNGQRYTVCDPTYINAGIGEAMPQFKNVKARVIEL